MLKRVDFGLHLSVWFMAFLAACQSERPPSFVSGEEMMPEILNVEDLHHRLDDLTSERVILLGILGVDTVGTYYLSSTKAGKDNEARVSLNFPESGRKEKLSDCVGRLSLVVGSLMSDVEINVESVYDDAKARALSPESCFGN